MWLIPPPGSSPSSPASEGYFAPLEALHGLQAGTTFSAVCPPPRERGTT